MNVGKELRHDDATADNVVAKQEEKLDVRRIDDPLLLRIGRYVCQNGPYTNSFDYTL